MGPIIHPNPLPLPVFCQYNPSLYGPLCPNCGINAVPLPFSTASSPSFPTNKVDENRSFNMMSDMFSSLDVSINKDSGNVSGIHHPCYNCGMHPQSNNHSLAVPSVANTLHTTSLQLLSSTVLCLTELPLSVEETTDDAPSIFLIGSNYYTPSHS